MFTFIDGKFAMRGLLRGSSYMINATPCMTSDFLGMDLAFTPAATVLLGFRDLSDYELSSPDLSTRTLGSLECKFTSSMSKPEVYDFVKGRTLLDACARL
jgi:hypothetical protein